MWWSDVIYDVGYDHSFMGLKNNKQIYYRRKIDYDA